MSHDRKYNLPGFTAEVVLDQARVAHYGGVAVNAPAVGAVQAAACSPSSCRRTCSQICDPEWPWASSCWRGECHCFCG
jgi:hypothetical protein